LKGGVLCRGSTVADNAVKNTTSFTPFAGKPSGALKFDACIHKNKLVCTSAKRVFWENFSECNMESFPSCKGQIERSNRRKSIYFAARYQGSQMLNQAAAVNAMLGYDLCHDILLMQATLISTFSFGMAGPLEPVTQRMLLLLRRVGANLLGGY